MRLRSLLALAAVAAAGPAFAQPGVIFSTYQTSATSLVPGLGGLRFRNTTFTSVFDRAFGSPDGTRWMIGAFNNSGNAANDRVLIVGGGLTSAGATTVVREGDAVPFEAGSTWGFIDTYSGINNAGQFAFIADAQPATTADEIVVRWTGTAFEQVAREGGAAPGLAGVAHGTALDSAHILANGDVRFRSSLAPTTSGSAAVFNVSGPGAGAVLVQAGTTVPTGNLVAATSGAAVSAVTIDSFTSDATGATTLYRATLGAPATTGTPANETVIVRNNQVIIQEGAVLPNSGFTATVYDAGGTSGQVRLSANGQHYVVQGFNNDGGTVPADRTDWVYKNGAVIAATDAPIVPNSSELWTDATVQSTTFFTIAVNNRGDTVVGGLTTNPDATRDAVLVLNGSTVLLREGDFVPFDVDGNGTTDAGEGKVIRLFNNYDVVLTDTHLYLNVELADAIGATASTGQAFILVAIPEPTLGLLAAGPLAVGVRRLARRRAAA